MTNNVAADGADAAAAAVVGILTSCHSVGAWQWLAVSCM